MIKEFKMTEEITFYTYERIEKFDEEERKEWLKLFEEQSNIYPELFEKRISNFQIDY
ncbi:unknown [Clostridium sp. CAG:273]|nr:unknown [Clostridium sp. CAG:273]